MVCITNDFFIAYEINRSQMMNSKNNTLLSKLAEITLQNDV